MVLSPKTRLDRTKTTIPMPTFWELKFCWIKEPCHNQVLWCYNANETFSEKRVKHWVKSIKLFFGKFYVYKADRETTGFTRFMSLILHHYNIIILHHHITSSPWSSRLKNHLIKDNIKSTTKISKSRLMLILTKNDNWLITFIILRFSVNAY